MESKPRRTLHSILDNDITIIATMVGFVVDLGTIFSFIFGFQLFSYAIPDFSKTQRASIYLVWSNPIFQGASFIILVFSYVVFCRNLYLRIKNKFFNEKPLDDIKRVLDIPLRHLLDDIFHIGEMSFDSLSLATSNFIIMAVFPSLFLVWYRVFLSDNPTLLLIALFLGLAGGGTVLLTLKGKDVLKSLIQIALFIFPLAVGWTLIQGFNFFLGFLLCIIVVPLFVAISFLLHMLFSAISMVLLSVLLLDNTNRIQSVHGFELELRREEKMKLMPPAQRFSEKARLLAREDPNKALKLIESALRLEPDNAGYMEQRGNILWELNKYDEACVYYEKAYFHEENVNNKFFKLMRLGINLIKIGHQKQGVFYLGEASKLEPVRAYTSLNDDEMLDNSVKSLLEMKESRLAIKFLDARVKIKGYSSYRYYFTRASIHYSGREFGAALQDISLAFTEGDAKSNYDKAELYLLQGKVLQELHEYQRALSAYELSLRQNNDPLTYFEIGRLHQEINNHPMAIQNFTNCMKSYRSMDKNNEIELYYLRAMSLVETKEFKSAESDLNYYLSKKPNSARAFWIRAICRRMIGSLIEEIRTDYKTACEIEPGNKTFWKDYILFEVEQKNKDQLFEAIDELGKKSPPLLEEFRADKLIGKVIALRTKINTPS